MHLPPVQPVSYSDIYVSGEVIIHESAVVAPGAILNAAPNSRIVIGAGVCVGMGAILNACHGAIEVEEGAVLGAGVLTIGRVKIGSNACIGAATTIFNASVDKMAVIPAGSLIGDPSRQVTILAGAETDNSPASVADNNGFSTPEREFKNDKLSEESLTKSDEVLKSKKLPVETDLPSSERTVQEQSSVEADSPPVEPTVQVEPHQVEPEASPQSSKSPVIGQVYINQLLISLFPERNSLNRPNQDSD
jgi:carbon dioxide concentrating mechanism protein CcmN